MYGILQRRWERSGADEQERLMLSFDKMFAHERDSALGDLFAYWQSKRPSDAQVPLAHDFRHRETLPTDTVRFICWADVSPQDPFNFVTHEHANLTAFNDHSDRRLGEHPSRMNANACASEYIYCIHSRQPIYHEIEQTVGNISRHYMRLMLPVADTKGCVSRLVYAVRIVNGSSLSDSTSSSCMI